MNKPNLKGIVRSVQTEVAKRSPQILMGIGIAGMVTSTVLAVKATPKALKLIEKAEDQKMEDQLNDGVKPNEVEETLTPVETVKAAWKAYIPAAAVGAVSIVCLIGSSNVNARRTAALATAYKLSETALTEYKDAVVETIGEKKVQAVKDKVAEKRIEKNPVSKNEVIVTGKGSSLCFESLSGRYFNSDMNAIKKAENELNLLLRDENFVSVNTLYDLLDIEHTKLSDELGWNIEKDGYLELEVSAQVADDGRPCLVIDYSSMPTYDYWKL